MKRARKEITQATLPAPITLTLEDLNNVATDTAATLGSGGGAAGHIIIAGGIKVPT